MAAADDPGDGGAKKAPGSYFTGSAGAAKKRDVLAESLVRWTKTIVILAIVGAGGYFVWNNYGDQIRARIEGVQNVTEKERYDPTKDPQVLGEGEEGQASKRAFSDANTEGL